jgi:hypothetical protein
MSFGWRGIFLPSLACGETVAASHHANKERGFRNDQCGAETGRSFWRRSLVCPRIMQKNVTKPLELV